MIAETSKYIQDFPNYSITSDGRVYSHSRTDSIGRLLKGRYLKPRYDKDGYLRVGLYNKATCNIPYTIRIHQVVAREFIPNPLHLPCVNHIDGNKTNNDVTNLEWCTEAENTQHAWKSGLCKAYDRTKPYNRQGIIDGNRSRHGN